MSELEKNNFELVEEFLVKVSEMYQYNLEQYPEENPTMIGAFCEILEERNNNVWHYKFQSVQRLVWET